MKLLIVDGNSLIHRAYHALPPMNSADGTPTQAIYGFFSMLLKVLNDEEPTHLIVGMDEHGKTFRHKVFAEYKAGRKETPDDLRMQFPLIIELLHGMGIAVCSKEGYEADDVLGTYARIGSEQGASVRLITGDRDSLQLISPTCQVLLTRTKGGKPETERIDETALQSMYGMTPVQMLDVKGLMGDSSDNIPGVPGVGEVTALKLIAQFGSLEGVYEHTEQVSGEKLRQKLEANKELAFFSRELARVDCNAPFELSIEDAVFDKSAMNGAVDMLAKLGLRSIVSRLPQPSIKTAGVTSQTRDVAVELIESAGALALAAKELEGGEAAIVWDDALTLSGHAGREYRAALMRDLINPGIDWEDALRAIAPLLASDSPKRIFDSKRWMHELRKRGFELGAGVFDALIASYLISPTRTGYDIAQLTLENGIHDGGAAALFALCDCLQARLDSMGMRKLYDEIESPLIKVLFDMECDGFAVDSDMLRSIGASFSAQIERLEGEIYKFAGEKFNILSPKQLGAVLFETLELPTARKTKTGYSTDAEVLEALEDLHPIVPLILQYRQHTKLKSTYIDGLLAAIGPDGRVHTSFKQTVTSTGRISSVEPNLQNIPVRTDIGREIRKVFIASPGNVLIGADYSQIELRVLAHIANDETMRQSFRSGEDIHLSTAAKVYNLPIAQVTGQMRSAAKAVNFGIVYGISDFGLAKNIGVSRKEAARFIEAYLGNFHGVRAYMKNIVESGRENGYVETLAGRRRPMPELKSSNHNTRSFGERVAMNAPIQGSAADIIKIAMVAVHRKLKEENLRARLILQVHDELIIEAPERERETVMAITKNCMENAMKLSVPLVADVRSGHSWYETK